MALGAANGFAILVVIHTYLESSHLGIIRIISARWATKQEWRLYEQTKFN
jgi:uncharacterized DUF497 family protein